MITRTRTSLLAPLMLLAATLSFPGVSSAQETFGSSDKRIPGEPKESFLPYSLREGLDLDSRAEVVRLETINLEMILLEDEESAASGSKELRYGVGRDLFIDLKYGSWYPLKDGSMLWSVDVVSEGALGMRLHFDEVDLPEGAELYVHARPSATSLRPLPELIAGPYVAGGRDLVRQFWTPTRDGERMRVELRVPARSAASVGAPFVIKGVQHIYRDPRKGFGGGGGAGPCHNDVTCFPAYLNVRDAVAGIGTVNTNSLWCTGTLLDAQNADLTPYWLTANHCLSTQGEASSAEIYWFYHTSSCNGSVPSLGSVPQSANCTLLATNPSSDFTLLMVEGELPTGLSWSGWTSTTVANGTAAASVHHPSGDFKRISFGNKQPDTPGFVLIDWTNGPTEPGSSGSGVFRNDTKQLFGQLLGGPSACFNESNDSYGAFVTTYPSIAGLLTGGSDDSFESNDTCAVAASLNSGSYPDLVVKSTDEDWYQFTLNVGGSVDVDLTFADAWGDVDVELRDGCTGPVVASSESGSNDESFQFTNNTGSARTYFMRVWLFSDTRNNYDMDITITGGGPPPPANDDCGNAIVIGNGSFGGTLINATNDGSASCGDSNSNGDVWYRYTANCNGMLEVDTCGTNDLGGIDQGTDTVLAVYSSCPGTLGSQLACNDDFLLGECSDLGSPRDSALSLPVTAGQEVLIRVSHWNTSTSRPFNLNVNCNGPMGLINDDCSGAIPLPTGFAVTAYDATGATTDGPASTGTCDYGEFGDEQNYNDVWFTYTPTAGGCTYISTFGLAGYDTRLTVYEGTSCPPSPGSLVACVDDEELPTSDPFEAGLDVELTSGQTYLIRLGTFDAGTSAGSGSIRIAPGPQADVLSGGGNPGAPGCPPPTGFVDLCNGDGGDQMGCTDCPCNNNAAPGTIGGCLNSFGTSGRLIASGDTSVTLPSGSTTDLRFSINGVPSNAFCVLNSGAAVAPQGMSNPCTGLSSGAQSMLFDGLRCAVQSTRRHGGRGADSLGNVGVTNNAWGGESGPPVGIAQAGGSFTAGQTRYFQVTHREDMLESCMRGLNTTQAVEVTFTP